MYKKLRDVPFSIEADGRTTFIPTILLTVLGSSYVSIDRFLVKW